MADVQRHKYGACRQVPAPVASATVIEIGDELWIDPLLRQVRPATDFAYRASLLATQAHFALLFAGIALSASAAGKTDPVRVGCSGVCEFPCASATFALGDLVGADDNAGGTALVDQQVIQVYDKAAAIGCVAEPEAVAVTAVKVEVMGNLGLLLSFMLPQHSDGLEIVELFDDFVGSVYSLAAVPPGWTAIDTSSAGAPTVIQSADCHGGAVEFKHAANDEAEAIGIDMNDELMFDIDHLLTFECRFRAPTISAVDEIIIGMISAQADAAASLTEGAWISVDGTQAIHCESDDTVTRLDAQDSLAVLGNDVWCSLMIDFSDKTSVKFYLDVLGNGQYTRVLSAVVFDMTDYASNLQPAMFLTKSGGTTQINLDVDFVRIRALRA